MMMMMTILLVVSHSTSHIQVYVPMRVSAFNAMFEFKLNNKSLFCIAAII